MSLPPFMSLYEQYGTIARAPGTFRRALPAAARFLYMQRVSVLKMEKIASKAKVFTLTFAPNQRYLLGAHRKRNSNLSLTGRGLVACSSGPSDLEIIMVYLYCFKY